MPNNENQEAPRKSGVSMSFIFSILLTIGIIGLFAFMIFGRGSGTSKLDRNTFVAYLENDQVASVTETPAETVMKLTGVYYNPDKNNSKTNYVCTIPIATYYEETSYYYKDKDGNPQWTDAFSSIYSLIQDKYNEAKENNWLKPTFVLNPAVDPYEKSWFEVWGPTIISVGASILILIFLFSRFSKTVNSTNDKALEFNKSRARRENASKVKFDDVAGADEEKQEMQELVAYLKEPKKFAKFGAKLPKGVLLVGPPGCGKTLLAKAVAGEAGVPFFSISGSDFVEMFVGVGAGRVRDMFRVAKQNAPCLIFIDEIDAVGRQRGAGLGGGNDEREQTLNQLLVEMDGFSDNAGIIVIAATNRDDVLDPALLRAGRFDRKITVSLPDRKGREAIFKVHARNKIISPDVDFAALARRTVGFSGADIENILNEAAILAVRNNRDVVSVDDIDEAIDRRVAGPAKSSRSITKHEKEVIAYHEAGHAIIGLKHPNSDKVQKITIIPRGNTGGHVRMTPEEDRFIMTKNELIARIVGFLGGRSSEEIFFDDISSGAQNDIEVATSIARAMVTELGMSSLGPIQYERDTGSVFLGRDYTSMQKNFSAETAERIDNEIRKIIEDAHEEAKRIILENKEDVILLANTLIEHEQITEEEIDYLLEHRHLKRDEKPEDQAVSKSPSENSLNEGENKGE